MKFSCTKKIKTLFVKNLSVKPGRGTRFTNSGQADLEVTGFLKAALKRSFIINTNFTLSIETINKKQDIMITR